MPSTMLLWRCFYGTIVSLNVYYDYRAALFETLCVSHRGYKPAQINAGILRAVFVMIETLKTNQTRGYTYHRQKGPR